MANSIKPMEIMLKIFFLLIEKIKKTISIIEATIKGIKYNIKH